MEALKQLQQKKKEWVKKEIEKIDGQQLQMDEIENQQFKWGEERRYDEAEMYEYNEEGIVRP